jgi:peroxiredoxin
MKWEKFLVLVRFLYWFAFATATALSAAAADLALLASCSSDAEKIATIQSSDPLQVGYSMAGESQMCYSVTVTVNGKAVKGYVLGAAHPTIAEFEREARTHVPEIPPPPPPLPAAPTAQATAPAAAEPKAEPAKPEPVSMAGFRGVDWRGNRVDLNAMRAQNVVVYFWSPSDKRVARKVDAMQNVSMMYELRGVEVVGIVTGTNLTRFEQFAQQNEIGGKQILDSGQIASRYHVSPEKPFLVLDRQRNVIAAVGSTAELEAVLDPLAGRRRPVNP